MLSVPRKYVCLITGPEANRLLKEQQKVWDMLLEVGDNLHAIQKKCKHDFVPTTPYDPTDKWFSASCYCRHCAKEGGWYCPKSKDHACEYTERSGECCIHCHQPDERK